MKLSEKREEKKYVPRNDLADLQEELSGKKTLHLSVLQEMEELGEGINASKQILARTKFLRKMRGVLKSKEKTQLLMDNLDHAWRKHFSDKLPFLVGGVLNAMSVGCTFSFFDVIASLSSEQQDELFSSLQKLDPLTYHGADLFPHFFSLLQSSPHVQRFLRSFDECIYLIEKNKSLVKDGQAIPALADPYRFSLFFRSPSIQDLVPKAGYHYDYLDKQSIKALQSMVNGYPANKKTAVALQNLGQLGARRQDIQKEMKDDMMHIGEYIQGLKGLLEATGLWKNTKSLLDVSLVLAGYKGGYDSLWKEYTFKKLDMSSSQQKKLSDTFLWYVEKKSELLSQDSLTLRDQLVNRIGINSEKKLLYDQFDPLHIQNMLLHEDYYRLVSPQILQEIVLYNDTLRTKKELVLAPGGVERYKKEIVKTFVLHPAFHQKILRQEGLIQSVQNSDDLTFVLLCFFTKGEGGCKAFTDNVLVPPSYQKKKSVSPPLTEKKSQPLSIPVPSETSASLPPLVLEGDPLKSEKYTPSFALKVQRISKELGIPDPSRLMAMISVETAGTFDPSTENSIGATGLIQFLPSTAKNVLKTTTQELKKMDALTQLDYVALYLKKYTGKLLSMKDLALAIFYPAAVGHRDDYLIARLGDGQGICEANPGLVGADGTIRAGSYGKIIAGHLRNHQYFMGKEHVFGKRGTSEIKLYGDSIAEGWRLAADKNLKQFIEGHTGKGSSFFLKDLIDKQKKKEAPFDGTTKTLVYFSVANDSQLPVFSQNIRTITNLCKSNGITLVLCTHFSELSSRNQKANTFLRAFTAEQKLPLLDFFATARPSLAKNSGHPSSSEYVQMLEKIRAFVTRK